MIVLLVQLSIFEDTKQITFSPYLYLMRQQRNTKIVYRALLLSRVIIAAGVRRVFANRWQDASLLGLQKWEVDQDLDTNKDISRYYIDETVILQWDISKSIWSLEYTHDFVSTKDETFALKSAETNLFDHTGEVDIKGKIVDFVWDTPLVMVTEILSTLQDSPNSDSQQQAGESSFRYFENAGVALDLSNTSWYTIDQQDGSILLIDAQNQQWDENNVVLSITPFDCDPDDGLKDCEGLKKSFEITNAESFNTSNGLTLTHMSETSNWMSFFGDKWYYVRPTWWSTITDFADVISFLDTSILTDEIASQAAKTCRTLEKRLWSDTQNVNITLSKITNNTLTATVSWPTSDTSNTITCRYKVGIQSVRKFELLSASLVENNEEGTGESAREDTANEETVDTDTADQDQPTQDSEDNSITTTGSIIQNNTDDTPTIEDTNKAKVIDEWEYEGRLSFPSSRWYVLYFSDRWVWYAGGYLSETESLTIWATDCSYWVKVTKRTNIDNVNTNPDAIIYECDGPVELAALPDGVSYITEYDGRHIIKKDITDVLVGMEVGITSN